MEQKRVPEPLPQQEQSPWFTVRGDLDDFIFYDPQSSEPPCSLR